VIIQLAAGCFLQAAGVDHALDRLTDRVEYVHVSLRIPTSTRNNLERYAQRQNANFNSLVSRVLIKYTSFDRVAEDVNAIPLNEALFSAMLEDVSVARLKQVGKEMGVRLIKQTFAFLDLESDIVGLIRHYFQPMSSFSGWYSFTVTGSGQNQKLMFEHRYGPKWSEFLKSYVSSIIETATGTEPRTTIEDGLVIVRW
jgi:hypothetical protein